MVKVLLALVALAVVVGLAVLRTWPPLNLVVSASMEPAINTGDVAIMKRLGRPAEVGDIVAVRPPQNIQERLNYPDMVLHRIVRIDRKGRVHTKGDARERRDPFTAAREDIDTHVVGHVPGVGRIFAFFTSPLGLIWLAAGGLLLVVLPYFELQRDQLELERAELSSIAHLEQEIDEIGRRVASEDASSRGPPAEVDRLDGEVREVRDTLDELVAAVGEYGHHLRSHTEILKSMSAASQDLAATVATFRASPPAQPPAPPDPAAARAELLLADLRQLADGPWSLLDVRLAARRLEIWRADVLAALAALEAGGRVETRRLARDRYRYRLLRG